MFKLAWSIHPQRVVAEFAVQAGRQLANVFFTVYFMKYIIESISIGRDFQQIVYFIMLTLVLLFALVLLDNWYDYRFKPLSDLKLYEKLYLILFRKAASVELKC